MNTPPPPAAPPRPRFFQRLAVWVAASALVILAVPLVSGAGPGDLHVLSLLTAVLLLPLVLGFLLTVRGVVLRVLRRPTTLHLGGSIWLGGIAATVLPFLLLLGMVALREVEPGAGVSLEANLFVLEEDHRLSWSDDLAASNRDGADLSAPEGATWTGSARALSLEPEDTPFRNAVAEALREVELPAGTAHAKVSLNADEPLGWTPLWKHVRIPFDGSVTVLAGSDDGRKVRWVGRFEGELDLRLKGFCAGRRVAPEAGSRLGELLRQGIATHLAAVREQLGP